MQVHLHCITLSTIIAAARCGKWFQFESYSFVKRKLIECYILCDCIFTFPVYVSAHFHCNWPPLIVDCTCSGLSSSGYLGEAAGHWCTHSACLFPFPPPPHCWLPADHGDVTLRNCGTNYWLRSLWSCGGIHLHDVVLPWRIPFSTEIVNDGVIKWGGNAVPLCSEVSTIWYCHPFVYMIFDLFLL